MNQFNDNNTLADKVARALRILSLNTRVQPYLAVAERNNAIAAIAGLQATQTATGAQLNDANARNAALRGRVAALEAQVRALESANSALNTRIRHARRSLTGAETTKEDNAVVDFEMNTEDDCDRHAADDDTEATPEANTAH